MTYAAFKTAAKTGGWTLAQLRFDVPGTAELMDFVDEVGDLYRWERFVTRLEKEGFR